VKPLIKKEETIFSSLIDLVRCHEVGYKLNIGAVYHGTLEYLDAVQAMGWYLVSAFRLPVSQEPLVLNEYVEQQTSGLECKLLTTTYSLNQVYLFLKDLREKNLISIESGFDFSIIFNRVTTAISWYVVKAAFKLVRIYDCTKSLVYLDRASFIISDFKEKAKGEFSISQEDLFQSSFVEFSVQCSMARKRLSECNPIPCIAPNSENPQSDSTTSFNSTFLVQLQTIKEDVMIPTWLENDDMCIKIEDQNEIDYDQNVFSSMSFTGGALTQPGIHPLVFIYIQGIESSREEMIRYARKGGYIAADIKSLLTDDKIESILEGMSTERDECEHSGFSEDEKENSADKSKRIRRRKKRRKRMNDEIEACGVQNKKKKKPKSDIDAKYLSFSHPQSNNSSQLMRRIGGNESDEEEDDESEEKKESMGQMREVLMIHDPVVQVEKNISCYCYLLEHYFICLTYLRRAPTFPHDLTLAQILHLLKDGIDHLCSFVRKANTSLLWPKTSRSLLVLIQICGDMSFVSSTFALFAQSVSESALSLLKFQSSQFAYSKWCVVEGEKAMKRVEIAVKHQSLSEIEIIGNFTKFDY